MEERWMGIEFVELLTYGERAEANTILYEMTEDDLMVLQKILWSARSMVLERRKLERIKGAS